MDFAELLERFKLYCLATGGSVSSWMRSPERNKEKGGIPASRHLWGGAIDVIYAPNPQPTIETAQAIAKKLGLYCHRESDHDHIREL